MKEVTLEQLAESIVYSSRLGKDGNTFSIALEDLRNAIELFRAAGFHAKLGSIKPIAGKQTVITLLVGDEADVFLCESNIKAFDLND